MGLFDRFKVDVKPLTKEPVVSFSNHFERLAGQLVDKTKQGTGSPRFSASDFEALWGIAAPAELARVFDTLSNLNNPAFNLWETALPDLGIAHADGNIFKDMLLKAQVEFPTDHHINWFTGSVSLDPITNEPRSYNSRNYSFQFPLYDIVPENQQSPQIYLFQHSNPDIWGMNFEVMAKDVSSFLYIMMLIQANKDKKISEADFIICFDKIRSCVKLPYYFFESFRSSGRWISYYDFNYRASPANGASLSQDYFNRSRWIIELLKGNHNNYFYSMQNSFYTRYLNPDLNDERHRLNLEHLPHHVPDAIYYLLRCFFRNNEQEQLKAYIEACKSSPSRIIRDAAAFSDDLVHGLEFFGEVDNIQTLKRDFAKDMKW